MNTAWFVAMLVGVGWLMVWSALPPSLRDRFWHPFDMAQDLEEAAGSKGKTEAASPDPLSTGSSWRERAQMTRTAVLPPRATRPTRGG